MTETLSRSDMRTIERAMANPEWHLPESLYAVLPQILINIAVKGSERAQIAAARVLAAMHQQNDAARHPRDSRPMVQVGVQVNGNPQPGRVAATAIAERIRTERLSHNAPG